jgi:N-acetyl-anhydromuramyl-L-alanine amidase AmpD
MWFGYSNSPIANPPYGPPGVEWNNFTEEDYQTYLEDTSKFYLGKWTIIMADTTDMIISGAWEITDPIIFPDESQVTIDQCPTVSIEDKPYDKCTRIFALKVVLAELADSKEQYEHWVSFEEGSFFGIYNKFFGFPNRLFEDSPPLPPLNEVEYTDEPLMIDDLLENEIFISKASSEKIQSFFEEKDSILKNYKEKIIYSDTEDIASDIIAKQQDQFERPDINVYILLVLMELKTGFISNKNFDTKTLNNEWTSFCGTRDESRPLYSAFDRLACGIQVYREGQIPLEDNLYLFPDGSEISFQEEDQKLYAFKRTIADISESKEQYDHLMSFEEGSFYDLYEKWFGWPNDFFETNDNNLGIRILSAKKPRLFSVQEEVSLLQIIREANTRFRVPEELAAGIVSQSPWHLQNSNGYYGVMDLTGLQVLEASEYTDISEIKIRNNIRENILAKIGLIAKKREELFNDKSDLTSEEWSKIIQEVEYDTFRKWNEGDKELLDWQKQVADQEVVKIFETIQQNTSINLPNGEIFLLEDKDDNFFLPTSYPSSPNLSSDYSLFENINVGGLEMETIVADLTNYTNRSSEATINAIVIHTMQGYYNYSYDLQNPNLMKSWNYTIGSDGKILRAVEDQYRTYHVKNPPTENYSLSIEHEGFISDEYTNEAYLSSARLVRYLTNKHGIPRFHPSHGEVPGSDDIRDKVDVRNESGLIGHVQVIGCQDVNPSYWGGGGSCKQDPGIHWDWNHYMSLIKPNHIQVEVIREENKKIQLQDEGDSGIGYFQTGNNTITVPIRITNISNDPEMEGAEKNVPITLREISQASLSKITPDNNQFSLNTLPEIDLDPGVSVDVELTINLNQPGASSLQLDLSYKTPSEDVPYYFRTKLKVPVGTFADIEDHWGRDYIRYLADETVVAGFSDGLFDPNGTTTRAEVLKMAYEGKKFTIAPQSGDSGFTDVSSTDWFYPYVKHAKDNGYIRGKESCNYTCFAPNEAVNRYEAAKMIYAIFNEVDYSSGKDGSCSSQNFTQVFKDVAQEKWFCEPVQWMAEQEALWNGEKEEASEKMQKRTDRIQKKLENTDLSPEKRDVLLARLDRLENPQEKIRIKNLLNS